MRLVDYHDVGKFGDATKPLWKVAFSTEICVAEDREVAEVRTPIDASNVRQPLSQMRLPNAFLGRLWRKEHNALALVQHETFDQHEPDKGLAKTDAIAEE